MGRGEGRVGAGGVRPGKEGAQPVPQALARPEMNGLEATPGPPGAGAEAPQDKCEPAARTGRECYSWTGVGNLMKELWKLAGKDNKS